MIEQFMEKLSREMELDEPLKAQIPNVYTIPLDEGFSVTVTSPSADHFALSSELGSLPSVNKEAFFTQLLLANLFGQGTHGSILGIDIDASILKLNREIDYYIEYKEFRDIVEDFINIADFWRQEAINNSALMTQ
jgi:hypothetical protein